MAVPDIPVFSFRVNWKEPLDENLSFLTDVIRSAEGAEQRRKLRTTPRRSYDVSLLLVGPERAFFDLFIYNLGSSDVLCPLYWETERLRSPISTGTTRIDFATPRREWTVGPAILVNDAAFTREVVEVLSLDANGVNISPASRHWPSGSSIIPLRRGKVDEVSSVESPTAGVSLITVRLAIKEPNPWNPAADTSPVYLDRPVFIREPNWREGLSSDYPRELAVMDNQTGVTEEIMTLERIPSGQQHRWFMPGTAALADFRDMIYRNAGRQGSFWLPTFKTDLEMATPLAAGLRILAKTCGYTLLGGAVTGRDHIMIRSEDRHRFYRVVKVSDDDPRGGELIELDSFIDPYVYRDLPHKICFMDTARFDSDEFTISHFGSSKGYHEAVTGFRTFRATRVPESQG